VYESLRYFLLQATELDVVHPGEMLGVLGTFASVGVAVAVHVEELAYMLY
jgi:hypothetical protein